MKRFIKYYALEIYTVLALSFIVAAAVIGNLSTVQKLVVVDALLFVLHEWEEGHYPGGFIKLISGLVADEDLQKTYSDIAPRMNILVGGRIGYESKVGETGLLGIMAYVDYNVWNTSSFKTDQSLISVAPITDPVNPVPAVTVNSAFTSLISRINPLQVGITLYYGLSFEK